MTNYHDSDLRRTESFTDLWGTVRDSWVQLPITDAGFFQPFTEVV